MFNVNKNYTEIAYRQSQVYRLAPSWHIRKERFIKSIYKVCPKCGTILPLRAKGCEGCLLQFDKGVYKNVNRVGTVPVEAESH